MRKRGNFLLVCIITSPEQISMQEHAVHNSHISYICKYRVYLNILCVSTHNIYILFEDEVKSEVLESLEAANTLTQLAQAVR